MAEEKQAYAAEKAAKTQFNAAPSSALDKKRQLLAMLLDDDTEAAAELLPISHIPRRSNPAEFPLSFAQQRLWFVNQFEPGNHYNDFMHLRLRGPLNVSALQDAFQEILRRHEALRATFDVEDGRAVQKLLPPGPLRFEVRDLNRLPEPQRKNTAEARMAELASWPFDLKQGPLFRFELLRLQDDDHVLIFVLHHIVIDGWSRTVLLKELKALYEAFCEGRPSPLPELPLQYSDYAVWQKEHLTPEVIEKQTQFWSELLKNAPTFVDVAPDRLRPPVQSYKGDWKRVEIDAPTAEGLKALARKEGCTLFMVLLAGWQTLLARCAGQEQIVTGTPVANRQHPDTELLIGYFLNTLALPTDLSGNPGFTELLQRIRKTTLAAMDNQELPFERVVELMDAARNPSFTPVFQNMFVLQNLPAADMHLGPVSVTIEEVPNGATKFDLTLLVTEMPDGRICGRLEFVTDLYDGTTIERMVEHFLELLRDIVTAPGKKISELNILTPRERHRLLVEWNETAADYPKDVCVPQLFERQVQQSPNAIAVDFEGSTLTYSELNRRANQLAHYLIKSGVGPETLVALFLERSLEVVVGMLGILKAGGAYIPMDPAYPAERLAFMLEDSGAPIVLTQEKLRPRLQNSRARCLALDAEWPQIATASAQNPPVRASSKGLAYVIYTSGSTGKPKGALIEHRGLMNYLWWAIQAYPVRDGIGAPVHSSISFDLTVTSLFPALLTGRTVFMLREEAIAVELLGKALLKHSNFSLVKITPAHLELLSRQLDPTQARGRTRSFVIGGENLTGEAIAFWQENAPETQLVNEYGPTETVVGCCVYTAPSGKRIPGSVPIGRPIANTQLYVLDAHLQPVPIGVAGELFIGGDGVARGYLNRPELTREKFIPNPFSNDPAARLYRTGDRMRYLADGNLEFLGRIDFQVKIRGYRIELGEIESVLVQHPAIQSAAVIVREEKGGKRLAAYVVPRPQGTTSAQELRAFLKNKLPDYMVPATYTALEELPLTVNGKVDVRALPAPEEEKATSAAKFVAPVDALEYQLQQVWEEILGVKPIGVTENFFDLGGHSMLAVRLFSRIEKETGRRLPLATLLQAPAIRQLAQVLRNEGWKAPWSSLVPIQAKGSKPPFFCVHGAGGNVVEYLHLARYLGDNQPFYGIQAQGLDGKRIINHTVEEMAAHYVQEICAFQKEGPYYLGGSSFGGLVAYEIAQQLQARGEEVALLALFDTNGPDYPRFLPATSRFKQRLYFCYMVAHLHVSNMRLLEGVERREYIREKATKLRNKLRRKWKNTSRSVRKRIEELFLPKALKVVEETSVRATRQYAPKPYAGRIVLFRATIQPYGIYPDPFLGWRDLALGGMEIIDTPGHHGAIVREPRARVLGKQLREVLDRLQEQESPQKDCAQPQMVAAGK